MHPAKLQGDVTATEQNHCLVVHIAVAITAPEAAQILNEVVMEWEEHTKVRALILDLGDVHQLDSSGVGVLMDLERRAEKDGVLFRVCCLQEGPRRLLERTQIDRMLHIYPTVNDAVRDVPRKRARAVGESAVRHSHRLLWAATVLIVAVLIGAGAYSYVAVRAYRGQMNLLPSMQASLVSAGQRIDATENALHNWSADRDQWRKRAEARIDTMWRSVRGVSALDQRTTQPQAQIDNVQATEKATVDRVSNLEEQVRVLQNPVNRPSDEPERMNFDLPLNHSQELSHGLWIAFSRADVAGQQFDARVRLQADGPEVTLQGRGIDTPVVLGPRADGATRELVVTRIGPKSVAGYLATSGSSE
jgi:anti-anti-sigma factor